MGKVFNKVNLLTLLKLIYDHHSLLVFLRHRLLLSRTIQISRTLYWAFAASVQMITVIKSVI